MVGEQKAKFDKLQQSIERLQATRYNDAASRQTPRDALHTDERKTSANGERPEPASDEETGLVAERDEQLDDILKQCLQKVVSIANDPGIRSSLNKL